MKIAMNWGILHVYRLFIHVWHSLQQSLGKAGVESVLQICPRQRDPLATSEHSRPVGDEWIHDFGMSAVQEHVLQLEAVVPEDVLDGHMGTTRKPVCPRGLKMLWQSCCVTYGLHPGKGRGHFDPTSTPWERQLKETAWAFPNKMGGAPPQRCICLYVIIWVMECGSKWIYDKRIDRDRETERQRERCIGLWLGNNAPFFTGRKGTQLSGHSLSIVWDEVHVHMLRIQKGNQATAALPIGSNHLSQLGLPTVAIHGVWDDAGQKWKQVAHTLGVVTWPCKGVRCEEFPSRFRSVDSV